MTPETGGAAAGWQVDENGNTTWKAGATWTIEGGTYTLPTAFPVASGYALTSTDAGVLSWAAPAPAAHNLLSAYHGDTTAGSVARGDVIIGSGATPKWTRLSKGIAGQILTMGADEPAWADAAASVSIVAGETGRVTTSGADTVIDSRAMVNTAAPGTVWNGMLRVSTGI